MRHEGKSSWVFGRSSADLLEQYYEDFLFGWGTPKKESLDGVVLMEQRVLEEQKEVESRAQWLARRHGLFCSSKDSFVYSTGLSDRLSLRRLVEQPFVGSDLYCHLLSFADTCVAWVMDVYPHAGSCNEDAFRAAINVAVVPAKVRYAQEEERSADSQGMFFADVEYELAEGYFHLAQQALQRLALQDASLCSVEQRAKLLSGQIHAAHEQLRTRLVWGGHV